MKHNQDFKTYKEKVLFIINTIRKQFGKRIGNSQPNFDLAWCSFIIENDYLQISNSISCEPKLLHLSQKTTMDSEKAQDHKAKNRRFSKTIQNQFGMKNKAQLESMTIKDLSRMSEEIVADTFKPAGDKM